MENTLSDLFFTPSERDEEFMDALFNAMYPELGGGEHV